MFRQINMDFSKRVVVDTNRGEWQSSPSKGILRIPLEREEAELGHTTSLVRYKPGTSFSKHGHPAGEEIFVLEGTFSDENGNYGPGTYLRHPPGYVHAPFSSEGCLIYVKLNQFQDTDHKHVRIDTNDSKWISGHGNLQILPLHQEGSESIALVKWPKKEKFILHSHYGGEEILVLSGTFLDEHGSYPSGTWIRNPHLSTHHPWVDDDTVILVRTGHLAKLVS
ncbi:MAG: cupin domain-containing protein [Oligoflexales bacterium]